MTPRYIQWTILTLLFGTLWKMPISLKRINVSDKTLRPHIHYDGTPYLPGKKYLCPGGVPLKYTIQHGNYCYQLYPYQTKDWMTGKIKVTLIDLLSNEYSEVCAKAHTHKRFCYAHTQYMHIHEYVGQAFNRQSSRHVCMCIYKRLLYMR